MSLPAFVTMFPKIRDPLPESYRKIYFQHYQNSREGNTAATSLTKKLETWMHRKVAADATQTGYGKSTLEIGAGTLNHLRYEPAHEEYDVVEPFRELYQKSPFLKNVSTVYNTIHEITGKKYDRIISVATFEHIEDLPDVVAKAAGLLNRETGNLRVAIPNEGTPLWKLGTKITGYEFKRKYGLDYQVLMKYEHVNTAKEIDQILRYYFRDVRLSVLGINRELALYRFYDCRQVHSENLVPFTL